MASEIEQEGSYSLDTIHRLSLMTRKDLEYFYNEVAPLCFTPSGLFKMHTETAVDWRLINLNIFIDGKFPGFKQFESTDERFVSTKLYNNDNFYIQGKDVFRLSNKLTVLNQFGQDLCKLGATENKIRKWTDANKTEILRVLKACGIEESEVKFEL